MNDFLVAHYSPCCCARKFWRKMALHLINKAVTNAYIIHSMTKSGGTSVKESAHEKFRVALGTMMLCRNDVHSCRNVQTVPGVGPVPLEFSHIPKMFPINASTKKDGHTRSLQRKYQMKGCSRVSSI